MKISKLSELTPDPCNANKGTQRGRGMLEKSLQELGAGRSILVDRNGVVIAGNKTITTAVESGFDDAIVVESDGTKLVVVKRVDLDLAVDPKAKRLAIADNKISEIDLNWSAENLLEIAEGIDLSEFFNEDELAELMQKAVEDNEGGEERSGGGSGDRCDVIVNCKSSSEQEQVLEFLQGYGYSCKAL
jgi:hypothetical protein